MPKTTNNPPAFVNPPLHVLNMAAREGESERQAEAMDAANVAKAAIDLAFAEQPRSGKRVRKPLRPPVGN